VVSEFRRRWAVMPSVILNNTLQEDWSAPPDSTAQWSHCAVTPLYVLFMKNEFRENATRVTILSVGTQNASF